MGKTPAHSAHCLYLGTRHHILHGPCIRLGFYEQGGETHQFEGAVTSDTSWTTSVGVRHELFAVSIEKQAHEIEALVVVIETARALGM